MKILVDAMSGDNAPLEMIRGAVMAKREFREDIVLVGDENVIADIAVQNDIDLKKITIVHAPDVITMEDKPMDVVRDKKNSSMSVALKMLADGEADALVSAGNTGALITGATLIVRRIKGITRAGIATILPLSNPVLLMDSGANLSLSSDNISQFAFMGSKYMEKIYNIDRPRVGQLNNGAEYNKGTPLQVESYQLLSESGLNFVGNIESKDVPFNACDVLVTDGFSGNILLKNTEGMAKYLMGILKDVLLTNFATKLSAMTLHDKLTDLKQRFDTSEHGGAPLLGIRRPVIKAHGSSDAKAIKNAVRQAISFVATGINEEITAFAEEYDDRKLLANGNGRYHE